MARFVGEWTEEQAAEFSACISGNAEAQEYFFENVRPHLNQELEALNEHIKSLKREDNPVLYCALIDAAGCMEAQLVDEANEWRREILESPECRAFERACSDRF